VQQQTLEVRWSNNTIRLHLDKFIVSAAILILQLFDRVARYNWTLRGVIAAASNRLTAHGVDAYSINEHFKASLLLNIFSTIIASYAQDGLSLLAAPLMRRLHLSSLWPRVLLTSGCLALAS
jgi:hypothetical protein